MNNKRTICSDCIDLKYIQPIFIVLVMSEQYHLKFHLVLLVYSFTYVGVGAEENVNLVNFIKFKISF